MNTNNYLKELLTDRLSIFEVLFELQNNGKAMNYWESYKGNLEQIIIRAKTIITEMKKTLPTGNFEIQIEDVFDDNTLIYVNQNTIYLSNHAQLSVAI